MQNRGRKKRLLWSKNMQGGKNRSFQLRKNNRRRPLPHRKEAAKNLQAWNKNTFSWVLRMQPPLPLLPEQRQLLVRKNPWARKTCRKLHPGRSCRQGSGTKKHGQHRIGIHLQRASCWLCIRKGHRKALQAGRTVKRPCYKRNCIAKSPARNFLLHRRNEHRPKIFLKRILQWLCRRQPGNDKGLHYVGAQNVKCSAILSLYDLACRIY